MNKQKYDVVWLLVGLMLVLSGCGGDGGGSSEDTIAPKSILGYKLVTTIEEVEIVEYSPTTNLLDVGNTMPLQFADQDTIYGESVLNSISHES